MFTSVNKNHKLGQGEGKIWEGRELDGEMHDPNETCKVVFAIMP